MTSKQSSASSKCMAIDLRDLGLTIARVHDLPLDTVVAADEVSENDDDFLTAICASANLDILIRGFSSGPVIEV